MIGDIPELRALRRDGRVVPDGLTPEGIGAGDQGVVEHINGRAELLPQYGAPQAVHVRSSMLLHGRSYRSPKLTVLCRSTTRVWFLLHRGQFHASPTTGASAPRSTGVLTVRGTPGQCG